MKAKLVRIGSVVVVLLAMALFVVPKPAYAASKSWVGTAGGVWTTAANWNPSGAPATGDDVTIPADQSGDITAVPTISLNSLTINGTCDFEAASSGNTITVTGNFTVASGKTFTLGTSGRLNFTLSATGTGTISGTVTHDAGGTTRTFTNSGDLTITSAGVINGAAAFTLSAGATLRIGSTAGITTGTGATGNIQVTGTRTYSTGANYVYNGTANQNTGTGLPTNLTGVLTINNPGNTVTLSAARAIANGGSVNLVAGTFAAGTNLTMNATSSITRSGGSMTGTPAAGGAYNVTYTGDSKTTGSELAGTALNNVTVNLTAGQTLTLDTNRSPDGLLTVTSGIFDLGTSTINRSAAGGTFSLAAGATLLVGGATNFPANYSTVTLNAASTVNYDMAGAQTVSARTYGNLILSGSGAKTTTGATVNGILSMEGTATTTGTIPTYGGAATLQYQGSAAQTTGTEFPATWTGTGGVIINNASGVTLNASKTINTALALTSGDLTTTGSYAVTMGSSATTTGDYDVVGTVSRSSPGTGLKTYGSPNTYLDFTVSPGAGTVSVTLQKSLSGFTKYVNRQYTLTVPGGTANVRLHYQSPGDLVGDPNESALNLWRYDTGQAKWGLLGADARSSSGNASYVQKNSISTFSNWAIGEENPTAVTLSTFTAHTEDVSSGAILVLGLAVSGTFAVGAGWWLMRRRLA